MTTPICPDRSESDALKGLFILIVVFAHNALLVPTASVFQHYIYQFHYFSFFILPFFYPAKGLTISRVIDHFVKFYIPYLWFFIFAYFLYNFVLTSNGFSFLQFLSAFCSGEISQLKEATGFRFLWFLPTFFMFTLVREIYYTSNWLIKALLVFSGLFFHFSTYWGFASYYEFRTNIPFAIIQAFYFFPIGAITWFMIKNIPYSKKIEDHTQSIILFFLSLAIFVVISFFFFIFDGKIAATTLIGEVRNLFLPGFFFMTCYFVRGYLQKVSWLRLIGKYSLEIYLIHVFVYNILYKIFLQISPQIAIWKGIFLFIATLFVTMGLVKILDRWNLTRKIIFPTELKSLKNVLKKEDV